MRGIILRMDDTYL